MKKQFLAGKRIRQSRFDQDKRKENKEKLLASNREKRKKCDQKQKGQDKEHFQTGKLQGNRNQLTI